MAHGTSDFVTAFCNQTEAFSSDLGDDQSRYLCVRLKVGRYEAAFHTGTSLAGSKPYHHTAISSEK